MYKKILAFMLIAMMLVSNICFVAFGVNSQPIISNYKVLNNDNSIISEISKGQKVNFEFTLKNSAFKTDDVTDGTNISDDFEIEHTDDSFYDGTFSEIELISKGQQTLEIKVKFKNMSYKGEGNNFNFKIKYLKTGLDYDYIEQYISECDGYVAPVPDDEYYTNTIVHEPKIHISRIDNGGAIKENEEFVVTLLIKNTGVTQISSSTLSVSVSEALMILGNTSSFKVGKIAPGKSAKVNVKLKALEEINSPAQYLDATLSYSYYDANGETNQAVMEKIPITAQTTKLKDEISPLIRISRDKINSPIMPGEEFEVNITFENRGNVKIINPSAFFQTSNSIVLMQDSSTEITNDLEKGEKDNIKLKLKALDKIEEETQYINVEYKYSYLAKKEYVQGSATEKIIILAKCNKDIDETPLVRIGKDNVKSDIKAGQKFSVNVWIKNVGKTTLVNPVVYFSASDEMFLTGDSSSESIEDIKAGETKNVRVSLKMGDTITSSMQTLNVGLKYSYETEKAIMQGNAEDKILIGSVVNKKKDEDEKIPNSATPNIIVKKYSYGDKQVVAGSEFDLSIEFLNTSENKTAENIVMSLETEEGLSIASSSNSFYLKKLEPEKTHKEIIKMKALNIEKSTSPCITISFNYEYVDNKTRNSVDKNEKIAIPLYQPDRFEITPVNQPDIINLGEETYISLNYVNKGKGQLNNVTATIETDMETLETIQNLGNFESGKSGNIDFIVIPQEIGEFDARIKITYENATGKNVVREFPFTFNVEEGAMPTYDDMGDYEEITEEPQNNFVWWIIGGIIGALIILGIIIIIIVKLRKKRNIAKQIEKWEKDDIFGDKK